MEQGFPHLQHGVVEWHLKAHLALFPGVLQEFLGCLCPHCGSVTVWALSQGAVTSVPSQTGKKQIITRLSERMSKALLGANGCFFPAPADL